MLARLYSLKSHTAAEATFRPPVIGDRVLIEGARMCAETAQDVTSMVIKTNDPHEPMGLFPWWYRIYYLHLAGITFLAAMFEPSLFTEMMRQSWQSLMSALRAHEHLSSYIPQCIQTFESLSTSILGAQHHRPEAGADIPLGEGISSFSFDDMFQDLDFDLDSFLFGTEDIFAGKC